MDIIAGIEKADLERKIAGKELQNLGPMKIQHENGFGSHENLELGAKVGTDTDYHYLL